MMFCAGIETLTKTMSIQFFSHTWPCIHPSLFTSPQFPSIREKFPTCLLPTQFTSFVFSFSRFFFFPQGKFYPLSQVSVLKYACFRCWNFQRRCFGEFLSNESSKWKSFTSVCLFLSPSSPLVSIDNWAGPTSQKHLSFKQHHVICPFIRTTSSILSLATPCCLGYSYVCMHTNAMFIKCLSPPLLRHHYCVWIGACT